MAVHEHRWEFVGLNGLNGHLEIYWCTICGSIRQRNMVEDKPDIIRSPST